MHIRNRREILSASFILAAVLAAATAAQPGSPHHGFLGGPWEIVAKMGHEGAAMRLPLSVADESKPQSMDAVLPVMGTPITVKLERYLPDLKWETKAVEDPNGGPVAKLALRGEGLEQDLWLSARDRQRQSISAHIGGVAIRELPGGAGTAATIRESLNLCPMKGADWPLTACVVTAPNECPDMPMRVKSSRPANLCPSCLFHTSSWSRTAGISRTRSR